VAVTINRREFLQRAGMTGGALAAAAALPACHTVFPVGYDAKEKLLDRPAPEASIDTIVIVMTETARSTTGSDGWGATRRTSPRVPVGTASTSG
jgi:hypothetical protein